MGKDVLYGYMSPICVLPAGWKPNARARRHGIGYVEWGVETRWQYAYWFWRNGVGDAVVGTVWTERPFSQTAAWTPVSAGTMMNPTRCWPRRAPVDQSDRSRSASWALTDLCVHHHHPPSVVRVCRLSSLLLSWFWILPLIDEFSSHCFLSLFLAAWTMGFGSVVASTCVLGRSSRCFLPTYTTAYGRTVGGTYVLGRSSRRVFLAACTMGSGLVVASTCVLARLSRCFLPLVFTPCLLSLTFQCAVSSTSVLTPSAHRPTPVSLSSILFLCSPLFFYRRVPWGA